MELWDVYDENRVKTGRTIIRGEEMQQGDYHMVVHVCIFGSDGKMLIQQRQPFKKGWSGKWDVTVGGSAVSGDTSRTAAVREVKEEIGLDIDLDRVRPVMTVNFERGFDDYYIIEQDADIDSLTLQPEEVKAVKWADYDEICAMIDSGEFIPYEKEMIGLLFKLRHHIDTIRK
ncbi:MAG: NUDIX domain-containing protein [Oscillospiraceae bacterium]|nr:NUDIX domain-containing protein [Oscillospiraceae bacterium]MDY2847010.1 NUDIX domain-containing protein [Oscillospiraceae bacterium]